MNPVRPPSPLLEVKRLKKYFSEKNSGDASNSNWVKAVDDISFSLYAGESLGLVGESGCGKSTAARTLLRLLEPTAGEVFYREQNILKLSNQELRRLRQEMQIIFQDPFASLNPRRKVRQTLQEPFAIHGFKDRSEIGARVDHLLEKVGLSPEQADRYPHEFSGGQLQRIGIARAIALNPKCIIADEPVSALDVSIRAQIINLMQDLKESMGIAWLFISHDMAVVEHFCDRVAVMYLGKIVELADSRDLYSNPQHPYTQALLDAIPVFGGGQRKERTLIQGDIPSASNAPSGCAFHTRCPIKEKRCEQESPELRQVADGHFVSCHAQWATPTGNINER
jgi:oligopeptide/dipeptide ABC transporter ATP-binding protein